MIKTTGKCSSLSKGWSNTYLTCILFFVGCFLYLTIVVEPGLIYFAFGDLIDFPEFTFDYSFFAERMGSAGGAVMYLSDFLSQWFYYPLAASTIITAVAFGFWLLTYSLIRTVGGVRSRLVSFLPALWVVILANYYNNPLALLLALQVSLACAVLYMKTANRRPAVRVIVFAVMFGLLYCGAGAASLVFAVLAAIYEMSRGAWITAAINALIAVTGVWWLGTEVFLLKMPLPYLRLLSLFPLAMNFRTVSLLYLYLFFPTVTVAFAIGSKLVDRIANPSDVTPDVDENESVEGKKPKLYSSELFKCIASAAVLIVLSLVGLSLSFDANRKNLFVMNAMFRQEKWEEFLEAAAKFEKRKDYDARVNCDINYALFQLGRLGDEMFAYQQGGNGLLLFGPEKLKFSTQYLRVADMAYESGYVNSAEHWAYEILETDGVSPLILKRLADINLVKGQVAAARVFLNALSKDLIHGDEARKRLEMLEKDPELKSDTEIQHIRSLMWRDDDTFVQKGADQMLLELLEDNPNNRMAFEYLMAVYLLTHNIDKLAANLYRLDDLGYDRIPRCYEEALLIQMRSQKPIDLQGREISKQTQDRFASFLKLFAQHRAGQKSAKEMLRRQLGDSYFFYRMFNESGAQR